jgi:bifunctional DNA-binding transcriptional regulator/antitoxin component of YhaV-PrlF toxin-antitoxin module
MQLVNENVSRKIDSLGRISIPKGLRNRLSMGKEAEVNFYTLISDKGE